MTAAEESATKSSAAVHKVKVVSPFIADSLATTSQDEEQQVRNIMGLKLINFQQPT